MEQIAIAIVGGLGVILLQWLWQSVLPAVVLRFQKNEPRIGGMWKTRFEEGGQTYYEKVTLKQRGRNVKADIVLHEDDGETVYKFDGTFKNLILSGTYQSADEADYERGAILLRYTPSRKFVGQNVFFSKTSERLVPSHYEWTRV